MSCNSMLKWIGYFIILVILYSKLQIDDFVFCFFVVVVVFTSILVIWFAGLTLAFPCAVALTFARSRVTLANIVGKMKNSADKFRIKQIIFFMIFYFISFIKLFSNLYSYCLQAHHNLPNFSREIFMSCRQSFPCYWYTMCTHARRPAT